MKLFLHVVLLVVSLRILAEEVPLETETLRNEKSREQLKAELKALEWRALRLQMEKEDGIIELQAKQLQEEIKREKQQILQKELSFEVKEKKSILSKQDRTRKNLLYPGYGTYSYREENKGILLGTIFGFSLAGSFYYFQQVSKYQNQLSRIENVFPPGASQIRNRYETSYLYYNFFLFSTALTYGYNVFESIFWQYPPSRPLANIPIQVDVSLRELAQDSSADSQTIFHFLFQTRF
ncbi:MAG: hypothetical protein AAF518_19685 [Spirochaetota bacterium]